MTHNIDAAGSAALDRIAPCEAVIESATLPVWIVCGVVPVALTVSAPVSPPAARLPPTLTVAAWLPVSVSVSRDFIALALIVVAPVPVEMFNAAVAPVSGDSPTAFIRI